MPRATHCLDCLAEGRKTRIPRSRAPNTRFCPFHAAARIREVKRVWQAQYRVRAKARFYDELRANGDLSEEDQRKDATLPGDPEDGA